MGGIRRKNNFVLMTLLILIQDSVLCGGDLTLVDNGYKGLVVAISDSVPEEHCNQVILGLKIVLQEFSKDLWALTGGRASFRDVTVVFPNLWSTEGITCPTLTPLTTSAVLPEVHIKVTVSHPVFGTRPWVHQTQGCGRQGDYIQMGNDFLLSNSNNTFSHMADLLMDEWVKFRWGIFEENGFSNDPLYPDVYRDPVTNNIRPNTCTSRHTNHPPICPISSHSPQAPTKHNAQCRGHTAWNIILQSQDFINGRNGPSNITSSIVPSMKYMKESLPCLVLVVEDTAAMNLQQRWEFVRKAVRHVMVYDVSDGVYVAIVVFNSVAKTTAPLVKVESISDVRQRVGSALPRNPSTVPESQKCVLCGFQEAMQVLNNNPSGSTGGKVILMTSGNGVAPSRELVEVKQMALLQRIRIDTIIYPLTEHQALTTSATGLKSLVKEIEGSTFAVMDEGVGKDSKIGMMVSLINALFNTMRYSLVTTSPVESVLIHSKSYQGGITSLAKGSFIIDDSLGPTVHFSVFYYDLSHVGNTVQLTSPTGEIIDAINMQEDGDANVIFANIPTAERGYWHYQVENRADSHQSLHIRVTSFESKTRRVALKVWSSTHSSVINMTDLSKPVIIYAEIKDDSLPVLNAKITARLQRLGTNTSGSSYDYILFDLLDNGNGDPDITGDDGVYSRYLPSVYGGTGHYQLSVTADHNNGFARSPVSDAFTLHSRMHADKEKIKCCGSKIKYKHLKPVVTFQRYLVYGVLDVLSLSSGNDIVPPNRILDLHSEINRTSYEISLHWTAPGDDYDFGRANHYEGIVANSWTDAKDFEGELINNFPHPKQAGNEQEMSIRVHHYEHIIYIVIRAVDEAGNRGTVSNVALQWVPIAPTTVPIMTSPKTLQPSGNIAQPLGSEVTEPQTIDNFSLEDVAVITGSVGGFLFIVMAVITFCYCHVTHRRQHLESEDGEKMESNLNIMIKTNSTLSLDQNEDPACAELTSNNEEIESKIDQPLSPTLSWRASELQQEHECRAPVTDEPSTEVTESLSCFQSFPDPFPDVTRISSCPYSNSQTNVHSDLTLYQLPITKETPSTYDNSFHCEHLNTSLPPYSPYLMPAYIPETSMTYTHEVPSQFREPEYQADLNNCPTQIACTIGNTFCSPAHPLLYGSCPEDDNYSQHTSVYAKISPPVSFKHSLEACSTAVASTTAYSDPKCPNVTHL